MKGRDKQKYRHIKLLGYFHPSYPLLFVTSCFQESYEDSVLCLVKTGEINTALPKFFHCLDNHLKLQETLLEQCKTIFETQNGRKNCGDYVNHSDKNDEELEQFDKFGIKEEKQYYNASEVIFKYIVLNLALTVGKMF